MKTELQLLQFIEWPHEYLTLLLDIRLLTVNYKCGTAILNMLAISENKPAPDKYFRRV